MLIANNKINTKDLFGWGEKWRMKNRGENMKENNLWGCLVMMKNRRDFGGAYAFSSCAIKKKPLQIRVIYRRKKDEMGN